MKLTETFSDLLWKAFLLFLPISSLTILSRLFGGTSVAPLSLIPMGLLLLIVCLPRIINSNFHFPLHIKPLYLFLLLAVFLRFLPLFITYPLSGTLAGGVIASKASLRLRWELVITWSR